MNYEWLEAYCLSKSGSSMDYQPEWDATRFWVGEKMFAMCGGDRDAKPILSLKCEPTYALRLRESHPDIVAAYYMNKRLWNSVYLRGTVPDELIRAMIDHSYQQVCLKLPKKKRSLLS